MAADSVRLCPSLISCLIWSGVCAGLDWKARAEIIQLLHKLKKSCTLVVVSHDLREISPLVDHAWRMEMGGKLQEVSWPPDSVSDLED